MDWERIKQAAADFDRLLNKEVVPDEVCEDARIMLAALMYSDAKWIAEAPKNLRSQHLSAVYEPFKEDVSQMAKMIIHGQI